MFPSVLNCTSQVLLELDIAPGTLPHRVYHGDYKSSIQCYTALLSTSKIRLCSPASKNSKYKINFFFFFFFNLQPITILFQPQTLAERSQSGHQVPGTFATWYSWLGFHSKIMLYLFNPEDVMGFGESFMFFALCLQDTRHTCMSRYKVKAIS